MATIAAPYPTTERRPARFPWLLLLIVFAAVVVGTRYSHALARHAQDAVDARRCFDQHGPVMRFYNPFRDVYIMVCQERDGDPIYLRVLRRIRGKVEEITSYRKDRYYHVEDITKYLEDQGAILEWIK